MLARFQYSFSNGDHPLRRVADMPLAGEKVIRGFFMDNLASGDASDNNIQDLGVVCNFNTIDIQYGDENPGNSADWRYLVRYANVL